MLAAWTIGIASMVLAIGTYVIWPSRWNIPAHLQLGFCLVAYIIPVWVVRVTRFYPPALVATEAKILGAGAVAYLLGLIAGYRLPITNVIPAPLSFQNFAPAAFSRFLLRRTTRILLFATLGLTACFAYMGFVPMFAADHWDAKYFKGPYALVFHPVAIPYRICFSLIVALIPLGLMLWYVTRRYWPLALALAGTALLALALTRGPAMAGLLLFFGLWAAHRSRSWTVLFLLFVALVYPVGAALYRILGFENYFHQNLWQVIGAGTPDVAQQLQFLGAFLGHGQFTYGRTFFAGLISGTNRWNPAVYSLRMLNEGVNLNGITSGGLRLLAPQWGFTAFGWLGVFGVSFLSGTILGNAVHWVKTRIQGRGLLATTVAILLYMQFGGLLARFYVMNKAGLVGAAGVIAVAYAIGLAREDEDGLWQLGRRRQAPAWSLTRE